MACCEAVMKSWLLWIDVGGGEMGGIGNFLVVENATRKERSDA